MKSKHDYLELEKKDLGPGEHEDVDLWKEPPETQDGWVMAFIYQDMFDHEEDCEGRRLLRVFPQSRMYAWKPP